MNPPPPPWGWQKKLAMLLAVTAVLLVGAAAVVWMRMDPFSAFQSRIARATVTRVEVLRAADDADESLAVIRDPHAVRAWADALTRHGSAVATQRELVPTYHVRLFEGHDELVIVTVGQDGLAMFRFAGTETSRVRFGNAELMRLLREVDPPPEPQAGRQDQTEQSP